MDLLTLVITLIVVGIVLALINRIPNDYIDGGIKRVIYWIVLVVVIIWILQVVGLWGYLGNIRFHRV